MAHDAWWTFVVWGALHGAYLIHGLVVALLVVVHVQGARPLSLRARIAGARTPIRWAAYTCAVRTIMTLGVSQSARFIYFQF